MTNTNETAVRRVVFRMAGYVFSYRRSDAARVRIDMYREDPATGERHWVTVATCAPESTAARSVALALVAWVRSCDVSPRGDAQSQAAAESFAMLRERLQHMAPDCSASIRSRALPSIPRAPQAAAVQDVPPANAHRSGAAA